MAVEPELRTASGCDGDDVEQGSLKGDAAYGGLEDLVKGPVVTTHVRGRATAVNGDMPATVCGAGVSAFVVVH